MLKLNSINEIIENYGNTLVMNKILPYLDLNDRINLRNSSKIFHNLIPKISYVYFDGLPGTGNFFSYRIDNTIQKLELSPSSEIIEALSKNCISFENVQHQFQTGVQKVIANLYSRIVLKKNGTAITWGKHNYGAKEKIEENVKQIFATGLAFAVLKFDGSVVAWGDEFSGGNIGMVQEIIQNNVVKIVSTCRSFVALKNNGTAVAWGCTSHIRNIGTQVNVKNILATHSAIAILKNSGTVKTFGDPRFGGNSQYVWKYLQQNVIEIFATNWNFAALTKNGKLITWGLPLFNSFGIVQNVICNKKIQTILSFKDSFVILKKDGCLMILGLSKPRALKQKDVIKIEKKSCNRFEITTKELTKIIQKIPEVCGYDTPMRNTEDEALWFFMIILSLFCMIYCFEMFVFPI